MVMISAHEEAQTNVPTNPARIVQAFLFADAQWPCLEETLGKLPVDLAGDAPGNLRGQPAERCRTEMCPCTRAVPHGSFL